MDSPFSKMSQNVENKGKSSISMDLLQGFVTPSNMEKISQKNCDEKIELTLGLSLNGRFGFDPTKRNELYRSSSIPVNPETYFPSQESPPVMVRTSSLPTKKDEAWRMRKEIQSLKRQEAKGRRLGKRKIDGDISEQQTDEIYTKWQHTPLRQGSTGSSVVTESASPPPIQGIVNDQPEKKWIVYENKEEERKMKNLFLEMPCVYTRGNGSNEKRIEGFLYKYNKGGEVKIVCVCHGKFLSPAEFVEHAGCKDVEHPLKHIVVNPFPDMG